MRNGTIVWVLIGLLAGVVQAKVRGSFTAHSSAYKISDSYAAFYTSYDFGNKLVMKNALFVTFFERALNAEEQAAWYESLIHPSHQPNFPVSRVQVLVSNPQWTKTVDGVAGSVGAISYSVLEPNGNSTFSTVSCFGAKPLMLAGPLRKSAKIKVDWEIQLPEQERSSPPFTLKVKGDIPLFLVRRLD
ncbi:MAG: hypothetical protein U0931_15640 [Vulcanimicrobiota bacterium]